MRVVISQSMLFPWVGMLEQVRLADIFVHYDDVQFSKGGFANRVQIKSATGPQWMTIPTRNLQLGQRICEVEIAPPEKWVDRHLMLLSRSFEGAPFANDAIAIAVETYSVQYRYLGEIARASLLALCRYFNLVEDRRFVDAQDLGVAGSGSQRVLDIVERLGGDEYITGHGAVRYLDHQMFERSGVAVRYVQYRRMAYPQLHGAFTPYVSALDLIANCGPQGRAHVCSDSIPWREFLHEPA